MIQCIGKYEPSEWKLDKVISYIPDSLQINETHFDIISVISDKLTTNVNLNGEKVKLFSQHKEQLKDFHSPYLINIAF